MTTTRRELMVAGTALGAMIATGVRAEDGGQAKAGSMEVIHIYADEAGVSHVRRVQISGMPKAFPGAVVVANAMAPGIEDWHVAPRKTFTINTAGDIEGEVSDGTRVAIGKGDLVYLEDTIGKGHVTRLLSNVANLFIQMPDDFDFAEWAEAESTMDGAFG